MLVILPLLTVDEPAESPLFPPVKQAYQQETKYELSQLVQLIQDRLIDEVLEEVHTQKYIHAR